MTVLRIDRPAGGEKGVALILALLVLVLVSAVGMGMVYMGMTETSISSNFKDEQTALFDARAGLEEVRDRLRGAATNSLSGNLPGALPGSTNGVLYIINPLPGETVAPWNIAGNNYPDTEICQEVSCPGGVPNGSPWYSQGPTASASYAATPTFNWKWVRVTGKKDKNGAPGLYDVDGLGTGNRVCWNGTNEYTTSAATCGAATPPGMPVYSITALAVTPSGSRRMLQFEATSNTSAPPPGAMIFDGQNPTYGAPNSNALVVNGNDANQGPNGGVGCGTPTNGPAVGAFDTLSVATLTASIPRPNEYTGTGLLPSVQNVNPGLGPLATVDGLQKLVNQVTAAASAANIYTGPVSSLTNPGTPSSPVINVVNGDLSLAGGFTGTGILLVTGTLNMSGNPNYNGLILVIGKGVVQKNGGGNGVLNGALMVANMYDASNNPIPLGANNPPGAPTINWNGGGNATIQYDSCWINSVTQAFPYQVVAYRELLR